MTPGAPKILPPIDRGTCGPSSRTRANCPTQTHHAPSYMHCRAVCVMCACGPFRGAERAAVRRNEYYLQRQQRRRVYKSSGCVCSERERGVTVSHGRARTPRAHRARVGRQQPEALIPRMELSARRTLLVRRNSFCCCLCCCCCASCCCCCIGTVTSCRCIPELTSTADNL